MITSLVYAGHEKPQLGAKIPEFLLSPVKYYRTTSVSNEQLKGSWYVLDFWFSACAPCIQSFPKVNEFHKAFKDRLTWIMVGLNHKKYKNAEAFYERIRQKQNLEMPVVFDSLLAARWEIHAMPHLIIVDPAGIVRHITSGQDLTKEKIASMLDEKPVIISRKDKIAPEFNASTLDEKPSSILYRSLITRWNGERQYGGYDIDYYVDQKVYLHESYNFAMVPLFALYNYAYFGRWDWDFRHKEYYAKIYPFPILETKDSLLFKFDYNLNPGAGTYNYNLTIPPEDVSKSTIMQYMQEDLRRYFKFEVAIENRLMPVWQLVADPKVPDKLITKGGEQFLTPGTTAAGFSVRNFPAEKLLPVLSFYISDGQPPFIDASGIAGRIDFSIDADLTNIGAIKKALQEQGLDLIRSTKQMKVMVIRDSVKSP